MILLRRGSKFLYTKKIKVNNNNIFEYTLIMFNNILSRGKIQNVPVNTRIFYKTVPPEK